MQGERLFEGATTHLPLNSLFNFKNLNKRPFLKVEGWALIQGGAYSIISPLEWALI